MIPLTHDQAAKLYQRFLPQGEPATDRVVGNIRKEHPEEWEDMIVEGVDVPDKAPPVLREFLDHCGRLPDWFDPESTHEGCRAFHARSEVFHRGFLAAQVENLSARLGTEVEQEGIDTPGKWLEYIRFQFRILNETLLPGSLENREEGWKLILRSRLENACRRLRLVEGGTWLSVTAPSGQSLVTLARANALLRMLESADLFDAPLEGEARTGLLHLWRCASFLSGVPDELNYEREEDIRIFRETAMEEEWSEIAGSASRVEAVIRDIASGADANSPSGRRKIHALLHTILGTRWANAMRLSRSSWTSLQFRYRLQDRLHGILRLVNSDLAEKWMQGRFRSRLLHSINQGSS